MEEEHENHGHSVATWTLVGIVLVGTIVGCIAVMVPSWPLGIASAIIIVLGAVAGKVLSMAGYGGEPMQPPPPKRAGSDAPGESGTQTVRPS